MVAPTESMESNVSMEFRDSFEAEVSELRRKLPMRGWMGWTVGWVMVVVVPVA